ncbi:MAG: AAA family ATPase [Bacteroidia bacterium]|nr:AAA family ATPase [Bacteroidia bacterium]
MIPLKLTIQGLYSYRIKQTIDFSKLTQAGLFGIFGNVGSGKSAILEAISFALFKDSERLNARENRNYNMMNLKSNELLIDFEFKSNEDREYRFIVKGKRNRKKFEDVKTFTWSAYEKSNSQWSPIDENIIESIIGLNYKNFKRTIIIPQGRFQEFLQLSPGDRTTMLKELFNLTKYELSDKVARLESKNNSAIDTISGKLQGIGEINPEKITEIENLTAGLKVHIKNLKDEQESKQKLDKEQDNLKKTVTNIVTQQNQLSEFSKSETSIKTLEKEVSEFERFSLIFKSDLKHLKNLVQTIEENSKQLNIQKQKHSELQKLLSQKQTSYNSLKTEYDKKDLLLRESEELKKLSELRLSEETLKTLNNKAKTEKQKLQEIINSIANKKEQSRKISEQIAEHKKNLPDFKILSAINEWFVQKNNFLNVKSDIQNKISAYTEQIKELKTTVTGNIKSSKLFDTIQEEIILTDILLSLENIKATCEKQIIDYDSHILELGIQNQLEQFAGELHEGKPCPLCGSTNHPNILNPKNVAAQLENIKKQKKEIETKIKTLLTLEKKLTANQSEISAIEKHKKTFLNEFDLLTVKEKEHVSGFIWSGFSPDNEKKVSQEIAKYETLQKNIEEANEKQTNIAFESEIEEKKRDKINGEFSKISEQIAGYTSKKELLASQIAHLNQETYKEYTTQQLLETSESLVKKHKKISEDFVRIEKELNELNSSISKLSGTIEGDEKSINSLKSQKNNMNKTIDDKLKEAGNIELPAVEKILQKDLDTETAKAKIEKYKQSVESLRKYIEELNKELAGRQYNEHTHAELKKNILTLTKAIDEKNQELGNRENEIKQLKADASQYALLKKDLENLQLRAQDITELKNLFRGSGFVNYVSTVYLENLCRAANERFYKLTRQKLGLELTEDNNIVVRDYMNEGKLRNVKTLSGGQTFQASLSLALSLADSIHKISGSSKNFFFLDEGFGTLDKESLNVVFDTLKALRKENRIVGVISHVEDMQQEIETFLKVTNDEVSGSIVQSSWLI